MLATSQLWRRRYLWASPAKSAGRLARTWIAILMGLLFRAPTLLGNYIARGSHCRVANRLHAGNPSVLKVGDSAKAQKGIGESGFLAFLLTKTEAVADFILTRVRRVVSDQICGRR